MELCNTYGDQFVIFSFFYGDLSVDVVISCGHLLEDDIQVIY